MFKLIRQIFFLICLAGLICPVLTSAQIRDVGVWLGASATKKVSRKTELTLAEQIRLNHDVTTVESVISDMGIEHAFTKKLKAAFHYRFINKNQDTYYSKRHRLYIDLSWKEKLGDVSLTLRERVQDQYNDFYSSEKGKVPVWTLRSKLTAKFDVNKKYFPYVSGELYYVIDDAKELDHMFAAYRLEGGIVYEFNRIHSLNPYVLYQEDLFEIYGEIVYGISYDFTF